MTDRDRLIELLEAVEKDPTITCPHFKTAITCKGCKYTINNVMCNHTLRMVDYLLANGVIVPPCKVGDKVYFPWMYDGTSGIAILEISCIRLFRQNINLIFYDDVGNDMPMPSVFFFDDFGKSVFLTKEEAEEKLRERSEGNE